MQPIASSRYSAMAVHSISISMPPLSAACTAVAAGGASIFKYLARMARSSVRFDEPMAFL